MFFVTFDLILLSAKTLAVIIVCAKKKIEKRESVSLPFRSGKLSELLNFLPEKNE